MLSSYFGLAPKRAQVQASLTASFKQQNLYQNKA